VLLILAIDPLAVTSVGAWLSVAAVWGTTAAGEALPEQHRKSSVKQLIAASVGATIVTAPITAFTFGAMAPIGIVANLVAVPVSGIAVPAVFFSLFAGEWMAPGAGLALAAVERTASVAAQVPGGHFSAEPGFAFAWPWALLLGAGLWARHRRPAWVVARRRMLLAGVGGAWAAAIAGALPTSRHAPLEIRVLDVGQGDAIAIRSPRGRWALIDAGPRTPQRDAGRDVVVPFFRRMGVRRLDVLVATHADADHLGGVPAVLRELDPAMVLENGQASGTNLFLEHLALLDGGGISWNAARAGDTLRLDSVTLAVLHPSGAWVETHMETNENSVVLRVSYGDFDAILTGDIGFPAESALAPVVGQAEVLKVGHHGSAGSSAASWLAAVRPRLAVISVGAENRYGHPAAAALGRLSAAGAEVWRTDRGGTVTIGTDGRTFWVEQQRQRTFSERLRCRLATWLPSSDSSSSRSGCTAGQRVSYPTFSTTSPSRRR
jgi:competence protein ComEC